MQERPANNFGIAFFFTILIAIATGVLVLWLGKDGAFQLINSNHNSTADLFFKYFTHYGDGVMWAPLGLFCFFYRKKYFIAVAAGVLISTIIAQFLKRVVYPEELRPISYLSETFPVHQIAGVEMRKLHSFPSGHATTAFTMALIMAHMSNKKFWSIMLPILAALAAYSRVYLSQHFPTDVLAGMCIGILSAILSLLIYRSFNKYTAKQAALKQGTISSA